MNYLNAADQLLDRFQEKTQRATYSCEMIDPQINDYIVPKLEDLFQQLINAKVKGYKTYFENPVTQRIIKDIDGNLTERFGIKFKHLPLKKIAYACFPISPIHDSVLDRSVVAETAEMEKILKDLGDPKFDPKNIKDGDNVVGIISCLVDARKSLTEQTKKEGIYIDLKNAKILNMPDDCVVFLGTDLHEVINSAKCNARECVAILLHEIGHVFTHIEYSHRTVNNVQVLVDTTRDLVLKHNKGTKENLRILYERATQTKVPSDYKDMKVSEALLFVTTGLTRAMLMSDKKLYKDASLQDHAATDSEQLADQFSGRFGLSADLSTGLGKVMYLNDPIGFFKSAVYFTTPILVISTIFLILAGLLLGGLASVFSVLGFIYIIAFTSIMINTIFRKYLYAQESVIEGQTYDEIRRRFKRMKNETVRIIANVEDKKIKNKLLSNILLIEKQMAMVPEARWSWFDKILYYFDYKRETKVKFKRTEQILEDLMSNEIYVGQAILNNVRSE